MTRTVLPLALSLAFALACGGGGDPLPALDPAPAPTPAPEPVAAPAPDAEAPPRVVASFVQDASPMSEDEYDVYFAETETLSGKLRKHGITFQRLGDDTTVSGTDERTKTPWSVDLGPVRGDLPSGLIALEVGRDPKAFELNAYTVDEAEGLLRAYFGDDALP